MGESTLSQHRQSYSGILPNRTSYVLIAATDATILNFVHMARVGKARPAIKLPYPHMLATKENRSSDIKDAANSAIDPLKDDTNHFGGLTRDEYVFNCAQRAHMNYGENMPTLLVSLLISGMQCPKVAAGMGLDRKSVV